MMVTFRHLNVVHSQIGVCSAAASLQVFGVFVRSGGSLLKSLDADTGGSVDQVGKASSLYHESFVLGSQVPTLRHRLSGAGLQM